MAARRITILLTILVAGWTSTMVAESTRSLIEEGNEAYDREDFVGAEVEYRKALEEDSTLVEGQFNLGGALYKQEKYDGSTQNLDEALEAATDDEMAARTWFNRGNALFKQQMYPESIDSYIESLKLDPEDMDAKYNLLYARRMLEKQQQQQQQQQNPQQSSDGDQQENRENQQKQSEPSEDQNPENQEPEDSRDASRQQEQQQDRQEEMNDASKQEMEERKISKSEAERILQALRENEKDVQKKLRAKPAERARVEKDW